MRVALHVHSTWSYDGAWRLESIARLFGRLGMRAVMMTEHDTRFNPAAFPAYRAACAAASTPTCQLIPGIEYSCPDNDVHILTWGLDRFLAEHRPVSETLAGVRAAGGAAIFAHPARREAWRLFRDAWVLDLHGIEAWNRKADGLAPGSRALSLLAETGLPATVGMDFHRLKHLWPLHMNFAGSDAAETDFERRLVDALRAGVAVASAFGSPLLGPGGAASGPASGLHARLEAGRRRLKRQPGRN